MTNPLIDLQQSVSEEIRKDKQAKDKQAPEADAFDIEKFPFGKVPGANKLGLTVCATCGKPATKTDRNDLPEAFMFSDELSAREYYISAMCQSCQDSVFNSPEEDEDELYEDDDNEPAF
jgi:hypothetical protein